MRIKRIILILVALSVHFPLYSQSLKHVFKADVGLMFGEANIPAPAINIFNGMKIRVFNQPAELGIGTGADFYQSLYFVPVSIGAYGYLNNTKLTRPFLGFHAGHGFAWKDNLREFTTVDGGLMLNPIAGMDFRLKNSKVSLKAIAGYKEQRGSITFDNSPVSDFPTVYVENYTYKRVYIGFGIGF